MRKEEISVVSVIGAGDMGHGIAQAALLGGLIVYLYDVNEESLQRGVKKMNESFEKLYSKNKISLEEWNEYRSNLHPTLNFSDAVSNSQFVFEAAPEILEIKQTLFKDMEALTSSDTILASNTSNMSISEIAEHVQHKERVVGVHFFNPVVMMKLAEVIRSQDTSEETMRIAYDLCLKMNKVPVRVEKDSPCFIVNRVNAPIRVFLGGVVDQKIAEPEEIDALMRFHGHPMGHFELSDYVGLDVLYDSCQYRERVLHPDYASFQLLTQKVKAGELGKKTGKGFYDWSNGRPAIDLDRRTDKINISDLELIKLNEAAKLIEEGVASPKDIDLAMVLGTGDKIGPIEGSKGININNAIARLESIAEQLNKAVLKPTALLKEKPESIFY
ncbi:3-hydroxyacyl-CoA dehydrogenase [Bacillus dakarensis]|uniref:3-hydroxyacyl-CoA dehydrogenase n=1 Tax=Robertmurraya dakarensis TaxID=1926278 RepID=UPI0009FD626E|nr:3-hydroxyacyl-CoA dehydrogenase [Bacillus dakarensis]